MKSSLLFLIGFSMGLISFGQKVVFLHHSTGGNVYYEGNVENWISDYNTTNQTNIETTERNYPDSPWPWENYPYDFWKLWVDGSCNPDESGIECLQSITQKYNVIIFKHCFPGAGIGEDNGSGNVASADKTIPNYKLQYRALRNLFDTFPETKFIAWTLAPLHRLSTNYEDAARANEFSIWVKNEWLTEDGKSHPNIFVFDFYGLAAETEASPANGQQFCLKYDYEAGHDDSDSHPNTLANQTIGPLFAQFIVDVTLATEPETSVAQTEIGNFEIYPNVVVKGESFNLKIKQGEFGHLQIFDLNGRLCLQKDVLQTAQISTENLNQGVYIVSINRTNSTSTKKLVVK